MALQVRPTRSEPGPNTGLRGRVGDEANVGAFHQGLEPSGSVSTAGYMCAILTVLASMEESRLATGRSPYMCLIVLLTFSLVEIKLGVRHTFRTKIITTGRRSAVRRQIRKTVCFYRSFISLYWKINTI
jgi:hypothetical protein